MTILAYVLVVVLSQFALTLATLVVISLGFLFAWLPERVRIPLLGLASGIAGVSLAVLVARLLFGWLAGPDSFGWGPYIAATLPLAIPVWNDWQKYQELRQLQTEMPNRVSEFAAGPTMGMGLTPVGAVLGVIVNALPLV